MNSNRHCTVIFELLQLPNLRACQIGDTDRTIKKQFIKLIKLFHSDKATDTSLPLSLESIKNEAASRALIQAYNLMKSHYWRNRYINFGQAGLSSGSNPNETLETPGISWSDWKIFPAVVNHIRSKSGKGPRYQDIDDKCFMPEGEEDSGMDSNDTDGPSSNEESGEKERKEEEKRRQKEEAKRKEKEERIFSLQAQKYHIMKKLDRVIREIDRLKNGAEEDSGERREENKEKEEPEASEQSEDGNQGKHNESFPHTDERSIDEIIEHVQKKRKNKPWELKFRIKWKLPNGSDLETAGKLYSLEVTAHHKDHLMRYLMKLKSEKPTSYQVLNDKYPDVRNFIMRNK